MGDTVPVGSRRYKLINFEAVFTNLVIREEKRFMNWSLAFSCPSNSLIVFTVRSY